MEGEKEQRIGPNVSRLIAYKMSVNAIPRGGSLADGLRFLSDKENVTNGASAAMTWVRTALEAVRQAVEPNPWRNSTDEEIATYLLEQIAERDKQP